MSNKFTRFVVFSLLLIIITATGGVLYTKALQHTTLTGETATKKNAANAYYALKQNTVDVLFCGSSTLWAGVSPMIVWGETGVTSFNRSGSVQYTITMYHYLLEALKTQTPKLVVLDAQPLFFNFNIDDADATRSMFDTYEVMRASPEKDLFLDAIAESSPSMITRNLGSKIPLLVLYPYNSVRRVFNYGTGAESEAYSRQDYALGGVFPSRSHGIIFDDDWMTPTNEISKINDTDLKYYIKTIEACITRNISVAVLSVPHDSWSYSKHNAVQDICMQYGLTYLDYNEKQSFDKIGLDLSADFSDNIHMNERGNIKFSTILANDLKQQFNLNSEYDSETLEYWKGLYAKFKTRYAQTIELAGKTKY